MQIHILHLGWLKAKAGEMIKGLTESDIRLKYFIDHEGYIRLSMNGLLIIEGEQIVMIDPGCAEFLPARIIKDYGLEVPASIEDVLGQKDIVPDQVTDVIFTHLHFDHGSGAFARQPGKILKRFPNARYHVLKEHFDYASRPHPSESNFFFTLFFKYIDRVHWLEDWTWDWIKFRIYNGHTKGMVVPEIKSGQDQVCYVSDLIPMEIFLKRGVYSGYDLNPELARSEKEKFLNEIGASARIILFHDPLIDSVSYP